MTDSLGVAVRAGRAVRTFYLRDWSGINFHGIRLITLILLFFLVAKPILVVAQQHLTSPNFWFDESGQIFLSMGSYHYAAPYAPDGGWSNVVRYSRSMNGDPGSFTALLRYWIALFGTSPSALRSLPFLFFSLMPVIIWLSARHTGINHVIAALAASTPLGYPILLHYATEVRPYSMEACAVVFLFFASCWLLDENRDWVITTLGCIAAILVASHYSAFLYGAAASIVALLPLQPLDKAIRRAFRFALPSAIIAVVAFLVFARYTFGGLIAGHTQIALPFQPYVLAAKDAAARVALLQENFLGYGALPITIFLLAAPVFVFFAPRSLPRLRSIVARTFLFTLLSVVFVALGSLTGRLPWAWPTRWSIGYQALAACCLSMILITTGTVLWYLARGWGRKFILVAAACWLTVAWSGQLRSALLSEHPYYETIASQLQVLARSSQAKSLRFFVQYNATPTTRYLVELGPLRGAFKYPRNFHFEDMAEMAAKVPISAKQYDVVVLTHSQFSDAYRARVLDGTVEVVGVPPPSCLLILKK